MSKAGLIKLMALTLIAALCLGGCAKDAQLSAGNADILLPEPADSSPRQIMGDERAERGYEVTLHYASQDALTLSTVTRSLQLGQNENIIERTLEALIDSASLSGAVEAEIEQVEIGSGIVSINLSLEAAVNRSDQDYLLLCTSIANTLLQFEDVEAVNILTGSRSDPVCRLPMGAFVVAQDNIAALYAQLQSESERFPSERGGSLSRNVLLYFPAQDGKHVLPEVRELIFTSDDYASEIIRALSDGPLMRSCSSTILPGNPDFLEEAPTLTVTEAGERILELRFSSTLTNYLEFAGLADWQLYACVVLTLCSFVPEIDAVRFYVDQQSVDVCSMGERTLSFEDGLMRRDDFSSTIGSSSHLYFASGNAKLACLEYPMARHTAASHLNLIRELISAQPLSGSDARSVFPEGVGPDDVLGLSLDGQTATVNLSANFYACCQSISALQERQLVYAMVNTLAELEQIDAVTFLVEGETLKYLAQDIYMGAALLPDPGLIETDSAAEAAEDNFP